MSNKIEVVSALLGKKEGSFEEKERSGIFSFLTGSERVSFYSPELELRQVVEKILEKGRIGVLRIGKGKQGSQIFQALISNKRISSILLQNCLRQEKERTIFLNSLSSWKFESFRLENDELSFSDFQKGKQWKNLWLHL